MVGVLGPLIVNKIMVTWLVGLDVMTHDPFAICLFCMGDLGHKNFLSDIHLFRLNKSK